MGKHFTEQHKQIIISMTMNGRKPTEISRKIRKPYTTVYKFVKNMKSTGRISRLVGSGRLPLLEKMKTKKF